MKHICLLIACNLSLLSSCDLAVPQSNEGLIENTNTEDTLVMNSPIALDSLLDKKDSHSTVMAIDTLSVAPLQKGEIIDTRNVSPEEVIAFAETLVGIPYVYGSTDPAVGFDCSGFITYVFNQFKIKVPRSSIQFTNVGKTVPLTEAKRGDIVLFTDPDFDNTNSTQVGHMGLITKNIDDNITFIHSTSGKAMSVAITQLSEHYKKRFVRIGRIFPQNDN